MKNKKYVLGFLFGLIIFMGGNLANASAYSVSLESTPNVVYTADANNCIETVPNNIAVCSLEFITPTYNGFAMWNVFILPNTFPYQGETGIESVLISGLEDYIEPPILPAGGLGIGFFKAPTEEGYETSYKSTDMLGQTATALQSTLGLNGLGSIIAVIGGLILAFGIILWIVNMFNEAKEIDKMKNKGKKI